MISLIEALNYRCLRYAHRPLTAFQMLVGPNASGKTTFMDVIGFLGDIVSDGLDSALEQRTPTPEELLFRRQGDGFELAVEASIPNDLREMTTRPDLDSVRYQVSVGFDETRRQVEFKAEMLLLKKTPSVAATQRTLFPMSISGPDSLLESKHRHNNKVVVNKVPGGNDNFYAETRPANRGWAPSFKLGPRRSALGNLVAEESHFPVATWFREYLSNGVQKLVLNSQTIKQPSPPTRVSGFLPDGSNLPWVVARLRKEQPEQHKAWIEHLQTTLPDLADIQTVERQEDKHCYMIYVYMSGLKVPSWLVSDGTLRLTALTLPAYVADLQGIYLIEEPENGIHPKAMSTVYDSLRSMYEAQVLLATHSPVMLNAANLDEVLCFARDDQGATDVVSGTGHPRLQKWKGDVDLGTLLASEVLE